MATDDDFDLNDPEAVMREARLHFVDAFPGRMQSIAVLFNLSASDRATAPNGSLRRLVHQMVGIAGTLGLPTVSERASDLEQLVIAWSGANLPVTPDDVHGAISAVQQAFNHDLAQPAPAWATPPAKPSRPRILVVEDDEDLRHVVAASLRSAGYQVTAIGNGSEAFERAQVERPALVLLDVDLPGLGGHAVCRKLKASPELSATPVVFMTTRASLNDRLTGQALGADDYLIKPIDPAELRVRIELLLRDQPAATAVAPRADQVLTYEAFVLAADEVLHREAASLAFMRLPLRAEAATLALLAKEAGSRDVLARYDVRHALWLLPLVPLAVATERLREVAARFPGLRASVVSSQANTRTLETLLAEVDTGLDVETAPTSVLLADDDPAIMRIVDAQLRAAGYKTELVFDGLAALEAVAAHHPTVLVLDLMMPKRTGFDVLGDLSTDPARPKVIVLSARGREEDVARAFALGADDYMTKPFSPQELLARVARLSR